MNSVYIAQFTGTVSIFLLMCIQSYILVHNKSFEKSGRIALLWTVMYIFFLFILRLLQLVNIGTLDQLRVISGFSALIPLIAVSFHLFFWRKMDAQYEPPQDDIKVENVEAKITLKKGV